ncbi:response regulator transcription factor [Inquilinus sp. Marseille-Q2685]|uniref:LuxR C-terminal-related transcriptional regulator n=1 Tax=Inquilinus sp. Marseille-Q2685 TaxID=2866581 RepID=UPI001CE3CCE7|nr:response regulator transcription factor [Inquilinus sp. Marseille-Q2685]
MLSCRDDAEKAAAPGNLSETTKIAIIDRRVLVREALTAALMTADGGFRGIGFADTGEWLACGARNDASAILFGIDGEGADDPDLMQDLRLLAQDRPDRPVIVIGDRDESCHVLKILSSGARGYIPTSVSLSVAIGALSLAIAGGMFVPATALAMAGRMEREGGPERTRLPFDLTDRQAAVAEGLARGKPNKIIAHELNLSEGTVKVHIRGIMKKLQARNRTEVAFKLHSMKARPRSAYGLPIMPPASSGPREGLPRAASPHRCAT